MAELPDSISSFRCTPSSVRRNGRRRLVVVLLALSAAAVAAASIAWMGERTVPAILALAAAILPLFAWRMSGDLDPLEIRLDGQRILVRTRRHLLRWPLAGATARRLHHDEVEHLAKLTHSAGLLTSAGGFDSHRLGEFELYVSDLDNAVLVDLGDTQLILTPDDPEAFLRQLDSDPRPEKADSGG